LIYGVLVAFKYIFETNILLGSTISNKFQVDIVSIPVLYESPDLSCVSVHSEPHALEQLGFSSDLRNKWTYRLAPPFLKIDGSVLEYIQSGQQTAPKSVIGAGNPQNSKELTIIFKRSIDHR
jgi:hypothetical protein